WSAIWADRSILVPWRRSGMHCGLGVTVLYTREEIWRRFTQVTRLPKRLPPRSGMRTSSRTTWTASWTRILTRMNGMPRFRPPEQKQTAFPGLRERARIGAAAFGSGIWTVRPAQLTTQCLDNWTLQEWKV